MTEAFGRLHGRASRRRVLGVLGAGCGLLVLRPASATPADLQAALRERFGTTPIRPGRVELKMPLLAESGNVVPVTVRVFTCHYDGNEVFRADLYPVVAMNPYFGFHVRAVASGDVVFRWQDDQDGVATYTARLTVV